MLLIENYDLENDYRTLMHDENVFKKALRNLLNGENRFHVINPNGENYDLVYFENDSIVKGLNKFHYSIFPPYYIYDENKVDSICLDVYEGFEAVYFKSLNEYSVVLAKIVLKLTNLDVYFNDQRILWFIDKQPRLHVGEEPVDNEKLLVTEDIIGIEKRKLHIIRMFHSTFVFQWLTDLPIKDIKYAELAIGKQEGIASVLGNYTMFCKTFAKYHWDTRIKRGTSRYSDELLCKYFNISPLPEESNETNTIYITNMYSLCSTSLANFNDRGFSLAALNPDFVKDMEEYRQAVIGDKKVLGVLFRGTDYFTSNIAETTPMLKQASVDDTISIIKDTMSELNYENVFVATEDIDILNRCKKEFGDRLLAVAQPRYSINDFKDASLIAELENKKENSAEVIQDTTVNYFYAIYILSKCDSFVARGSTSAMQIVFAFNQGKFKKISIASQVH